MTSSVLSSPTSIADDGAMRSPRAGGPSRRRSFTPAQKLAHLAEYEAACANGEGGAYLRREGLYSSLISEWRRLRDAGLLEGKQPGAKVGRPSTEQAELARLRRRLAEAERRLSTTETALEIMGKAHALLEQISESAETERPEQPRRKR
jgi:transposase